MNGSGTGTEAPHPEHRLTKWLRARRAWQLVVITVLSDFALRLLSLPLLRLASQQFGHWSEGPEALSDSPDLKFLLFALLIAPVLETAVFQLGIQRGLGFIPSFQRRPGVPIWLSGVLFAAMHRSSVAHIIGSLGAGLLFAFIFHVGGPTWRAFGIVVVSHGVINGLVALLSN